MLSKDALALLAALFGPQSSLSVPAGVAGVVIEIRAWVQAQIAAASGR